MMPCISKLNYYHINASLCDVSKQNDEQTLCKYGFKSTFRFSFIQAFVSIIDFPLEIALLCQVKLTKLNCHQTQPIVITNTLTKNRLWRSKENKRK